MSFAGVNYVAVIVAAVVAFFFSGIYYRALGDAWVKAIGFTNKTLDKRGMRTPLVIAAVANLVMAWVLAGLLAHLGPGQVTLKNGLVSGAFAWLGFVVTTLAVNYAFGMRKPTLMVIDAAHWLLVLVIMGAIIGAFGV